MAKKWIIGIVIVALTGLLVYGAVLRTSARSEPVTAGGRGNQAEGGLGRGRSADTSLNQPLNQALLDQWVTVTGTVSQMDAVHLQITTNDGQVIELENRPWQFIQSTLKVAVGDAVTLVGFYEGETFEIGKITVEKTGQLVAVRDDYGRPLWSGRGRN